MGPRPGRPRRAAPRPGLERGPPGAAAALDALSAAAASSRSRTGPAHAGARGAPPADAADPGATDSGALDPGAFDSDAAALDAAHPDAPPESPTRLYGEPLLRLPRDLYIPPDALVVLLEAFEGPLDLLLYLIRRQGFDILDIPMAEVTRQYLAYIDGVRAAHFELAGEYLLMAAVLIDIKSRMLLPQRRAAPDDEPADPRAELARRLIEYERMRAAAAALDALPQLGRDVFAARVAQGGEAAPATLAAIDLEQIRAAWAEVLRRASLVERHRIAREALSVREHMTEVLRALGARPFAEFGELFDAARGVAFVVVTFLAILELARESLVEITQAAAYAPIYLRLAREPQAATGMDGNAHAGADARTDGGAAADGSADADGDADPVADSGPAPA